MSIEERLQRLEDAWEITQLIASYGPLVDAGEAVRVADLWTEDGVYDAGELFMGSRAEIDEMVRSDAHQGLIGSGCSHFLGPAQVSVDGDRAVAVCESVLLVRHHGKVLPARIGANHFELVRTPDGWRTTRRTTRGLDGSADARELLARTGVL
ncbi:MAG TPA: nuclear transport factor 2 family protein [Nocardioides sp.]|nr:nuclear transport factor 2 family protein [Nocardioides sp.]